MYYHLYSSCLKSNWRLKSARISVSLIGRSVVHGDPTCSCTGNTHDIAKRFSLQSAKLNWLLCSLAAHRWGWKTRKEVEAFIIISMNRSRHQEQRQQERRGRGGGDRRRRDRGGVRQVGVRVRRRHLALVAVEVDLPRERPALAEGEGAGVLAHEHLRLDVAEGPGLHEQVIVELEPVEHAGVVDGAVGEQWLVLEAEDLGDVVQVGVLRHQRPLRVVHPVVEVGDGDLGAPVVLVVELDVPVDADRAHVRRALEQRLAVLARRVDAGGERPLGVAGDAAAGGVSAVAAAAGAAGAGHDGAVVEGGEGDAAGGVLGGQLLRVGAGDRPRHERLRLAAAVGGEVDGGGDDPGGAAGVAGPGALEGEVLGELDRLVGGAGEADGDLEGGDGAGGVLAVGGDDAGLAAVGDLLIVGDAREEVDDGGGALAAVRDAALELGAVALLRGLRADDGPDHLLLGPRPPHRPPGRHDVTVHLVVAHRHHRLQCNHPSWRSPFVNGIVMCRCRKESTIHG
jgi:hypothetical protein